MMGSAYDSDELVEAPAAYDSEPDGSPDDVPPFPKNLDYGMKERQKQLCYSLAHSAVQSFCSQIPIIAPQAGIFNAPLIEPLKADTIEAADIILVLSQIKHLRPTPGINSLPCPTSIKASSIDRPTTSGSQVSSSSSITSSKSSKTALHPSTTTLATSIYTQEGDETSLPSGTEINMMKQDCLISFYVSLLNERLGRLNSAHFYRQESLALVESCQLRMTPAKPGETGSKVDAHAVLNEWLVEAGMRS